MIDPETVQILPRPLAESSTAIALFCVREVLTVAMAEPQDLTLIDELERVTGLRVNPVFALRETPWAGRLRDKISVVSAALAKFMACSPKRVR